MPLLLLALLTKAYVPAHLVRWPQYCAVQKLHCLWQMVCTVDFYFFSSFFVFSGRKFMVAAQVSRDDDVNTMKVQAAFFQVMHECI